MPQVLILIAFGLIIAGGLGVSTSDAALAKVRRNTNLSNLLVGIHTLSIHRLPHRMAIYMLMLLGVALVSGFVVYEILSEWPKSGAVIM